MPHSDEKKAQLRRRANVRRAEDREISDQFQYGFYKSGARKGCPKPKNLARRERCKLDAEKFLMTYFPMAFYLPMSPGQKSEIKTAQQIIIDGGQQAQAAPRGDGKTTRIERLTIYAMFYGYHRFCVPVASNKEAADDILSEIKKEISTNDLLMEDFPEVCIPARACGDSPHKAKTLTLHGNPLCFSWTGDEIVFPEIPGSASSGSLMKPKGLLGGIRGMKHTLSSGDIIRPTLFLIDDPQTDESAKSPTQIKTRIKLILGAVLGSGGPTDRTSAFMPCTIIEVDDLAARFLDRDRYPEWHGTTRAMVKSFPTVFEEDERGESLWHKYNEIRNDEFRADKTIAVDATAFYEEHRDEMDAGSEVDNPHRVIDGDVSAIQTAMNLYFTRGRDVFFAEYQNSPTEAQSSIYTITPAVVASRVNGMRRFQIHEDAQFLTCMADINYIGLTFTVCAFKNDYTGWIPDYGKYPAGSERLISPNMTEAEISRRIAQAIKEFWKLLEMKVFMQGKERRNLDIVLIDCNWKTRIAMAAIKSLRLGRMVIADRGTPSLRYKTPADTKRIGAPGHMHHMEKGNYGPQVRHDSDFWRMAAQKAFLVEPGIPGSMSFWGNDPHEHRNYAEEVCSEKLVQYVPGDPADLFQWTPPKGPNDKLDSLVGNYPAAGILGAQLPGYEPRVRKKKKPRRPRGSSGTGIRTRY